MAGGFSASSVVSLSSFGCSGAVSAAGEKADMHRDKYLERQCATLRGPESHTNSELSRCFDWPCDI